MAGARPTRPTRPTRSTRSTRSTRPGAIGRATNATNAINAINAINAARRDRPPRRTHPSTVNSQQSTVNNRFSILRTFGSRHAGPHLTCIRKFAACVCKAVPMRRMRAAFSGGASDENG
ncbi:hypothetical protein BPC006_II2578 [Burkholderia pseudomallei BPC006]|nr:hypothetical protein BPC006_II2578 [Burkholderia pseudomallei BPC006]